jgi:histidyl-tRNA synthetase
MLRLVAQYGLTDPRLELDVTLARGLSYYTGAIFEIKTNQVQIGSLGGGGRYDNLTGAFGMPGLSGVGISFGVDRLYDVLDELKLFPATTGQSTRVLLACLDPAEGLPVALPLLTRLRAGGIPAEVYPDTAKLKKQLDFANQKQIPFVILIGPDEVASGLFTLKNMTTGGQSQHTADDLISRLGEIL